MIVVLLTLMTVGNLCYPTSRLLFYFGYKKLQLDDPKSETFFKMSAVFGGLYTGSIYLLLWLFAMKMWALSKQIRSIQNGTYVEAYSKALSLLYYTGGVINLCAGVV